MQSHGLGLNCPRKKGEKTFLNKKHSTRGARFNISNSSAKKLWCSLLYIHGKTTEAKGERNKVCKEESVFVLVGKNSS